MEALNCNDQDKTDDGSIYSDVESINASAVGEDLENNWYDDHDMIEYLKENTT